MRRFPSSQQLYYLQRSLALAEAAGDQTGIAKTLVSLGNVHRWQGNIDEALECYQKSLALAETLREDAVIDADLQNIGIVHRVRGNYGKALEYLEKSLTLSKASRDRLGTVMSLNSIGIVHQLQGNFALALKYFEDGLALLESIGGKTASDITLNIGSIHYNQGNYTKALEYLRQSLAYAETSESKTGVIGAFGGIGDVYLKQGNYDQAFQSYQKCLTLSTEINNKDEIINSLLCLGTLRELQGYYDQALDFADRASDIAKQIGSREKFWASRALAGKVHYALKQDGHSRRAFEESIATIEDLRAEVTGGEREQQHFLENKISPYHAIVNLLVAENKTSEAFAYAERTKARALLDVLHSGRVNLTKAMTAAERGRERGFKNQLVSLNTQISRENLRPQPDPARLSDLKAQLQKARLDYEAFQTGLYAAHPELKAQRGEAELLTLEQVRDLLPDAQSALLEYVVTDGRTYLFALTRNSGGTTAELKVYPLEIKRKELSERAARFRETLAKGSPGFRQPARELYDLLLKPAAAQLQGKMSLVIVPDGALWELPFQALQPAPNRYLIEDCAIAYAPSLTALREMGKQRDRKKDSASSPTLLAFGNPALGKQTAERVKSVLMDEKLDPLPEAERQVNVMKQIYGAAKSKIYIGAEAREERAKAEAGGYRILHLATHGILNDSSPMYSHVLLAQAEGGNGEDGLLEAWEIMKLDLKADLAVLSACETARGRIGAGEGMIGLSWALFVAGCPTSVVSQWKVDSASTTELMLEFHRQLKSQMTNRADSFSAARALREAALKLQRTASYRHPFYWAGFVVAGKGF